MYIINFCGIWPYRYDGRTKEFKWIWYYGLMQFLTLLQVLLLFILNNDVILLDSHIHFENFVLRFIAKIYSGYCNINFLVLYFGQAIFYKDMKSIVIKGFNLIEHLKLELNLNESRYLTYLIRFTVKSVGGTCFLLLAIGHNVTGIYPTTKNFIIFSGYIMPNLIVKIFPDAFYGFNLVAQFYFKEINKKLKEILNQSTQDDTLKETFNKLEKILLLHQNVIEVMSSINKICTVQLLCYLVFETYTLLIYCFIEYMLLLDILRNGLRDVNPLSSFFGTYVSISVLLAELLFVTSICKSVTLEVKNDSINEIKAQ